MPVKHLYGKFTGKPIPGSVSRSILDSIQNNQINDNLLLEYEISKEDLIDLKNQYQARVKDSSLIENKPRHYIFYQILKEKFPHISWRIIPGNPGKFQVIFDFPLINSVPPSILSMLLGRVTLIDEVVLYKKYQCTQAVPSKIIKPIDKFIKEVDAVYPTESHLQLFLDWIFSMQHSKKGTVFINICPDYATEPTGERHRPYRHTFAFLGDNLGQIAMRIVKALPVFVRLLQELNVSPEIVVGIGDFEAFSKATLERVELTENEFLSKVSKSLKAFEAACSQLPIKIKTICITGLCGGKQAWLDKIDEIINSFDKNDFGNICVDDNIFLEIARRRKSLYSRWYGKQTKLEAYVPIAKYQAAEYAAIGYYAANTFDNCFVLGADSSLFGDFYSYLCPVPTFYLKRYYY